MIRIALALTCIVLCVFFGAHSLGLLPDAELTAAGARGNMCEEVALVCAARLQRCDDAGLRSYLLAFLNRRPEIVSAGLRTSEKTLVFEKGVHPREEPRASTHYAKIPLLLGDRTWGHLEVCFRPVQATIAGLSLFWSATLFFGLVTFGSAYGYLRLALKLSSKNGKAADRVRAMLNTVAEGVLILDKEQRITLANETFAAKVGMPAQQLMGLKVDDLAWQLGGKAPAQDVLPWKKTIHSKEVAMGALLTLTNPAGARNFSVNSSPVLDNDGQCKGVLATFDDLTPLENKNTELRQTLRQLKASRQKIQSQAKDLKKAKVAAEEASQAKTDFLANVSHEIRTPMNTILGMTDLALETNLPHELRECFELVKISGNSLLELINDLLDLSKVEAGKFALERLPFSLHQSLNDTLKFLAVRAHEKDLELLCDIQPNVPEGLLGDPTRLRQILVNLVGNALKFTSEGQILVRVTLEQQSPGEVCLHFQIQDTGVGIAHDKLESIFEPFVQADGSTTRRFGGTGLGLAICRQLVELMQGRIWVESTEGQGSSFHFLANFGRDAAEQANVVVPGEPASGERGRVLVVDDNPVGLEILASLLRDLGFEVNALGKNLKAVSEFKSAQAAGTPYNLVILDGRMPDVDGFDIAAALRKTAENGPPLILLLNSAHKKEELARCNSIERVVPLAKPVTKVSLALALDNALGGAASASAGRPADSDADLVPTLPPLHILLVDDNAFNLKVGSMKLTRHGHKVELASSGPEALQALQQTAFDILLLDMQMPEMDGQEVTRRIRLEEQTSGRRLPIIAMTAHALEEIRKSCLENGMDGYVSKPIRDEQLWSEIQRVLPREVLERSPLVGQDSDPDSVGQDSDPDRQISNCQAWNPDPQASAATSAASAVTENAHADPILARVGGNLTLLNDLRLTFRSETDNLLTGLQKAQATKDQAQWRIVTHTLKGMLGFFGAAQASEILRDLEELGKKESWERAELLLDDLRREVRSVDDKVARLCQNGSTS